MSRILDAIERQVFETQEIIEKHPPVWRDRNKRIVFEIACPPGCVHRGQLLYSRWPAMPLPETIDAIRVLDRIEGREDVYDYGPAPSAGAVEWHVNFADPSLFVFYGSSLFAQDEMQVAEHPALGALKEVLDAEGRHAVTIENGQPTPVLVMGVERRCSVATDRNTGEGRPQGLYGNAFGRADGEAVRRATTRIEPPTITNLIAMAAPSYGYGLYTEHQIEQVLITAFTGFRAAVMESNRQCGEDAPVVVHTGFWGCGAFGGNRVLMPILQALAAQMSGLESLVFHTVHAAGAKALDAAKVLIKEELVSELAIDMRVLIQRITSMGFEWSVSDGN